ncbi:MAG TPA: hypothetical protein VI612_00220 [Candidatus Nanoarchaeia archaeon]|nr:hypothetical protein [Candidatus Nanoarchaeia archaeon]
MRCRLILLLSVIALLILTSCGECKVDADCPAKQAHTAKCLDKECKYAPIPGQCGNGLCDANEDKCTCPSDCGPCAGAVPGSKYLTQECVQNKCLQDVSGSKIQPVAMSADINSAGDKFKIDTLYNQPFNLKKDTFDVTVTLGTQGPQNSDELIVSMELTARTKEGRTITLARQDVNRYLWSTGSSFTQQLILDFPTAEIEGELTGLVLKVSYEYSLMQAGKKARRQAPFINNYREKFVFVNPTTTYPCPASCDDKNPGTRDTCGPQTNYFCIHEPIPGTCGNGICDGNENKCTCPSDCGPCSGSAGNFIDYTCKNNECITMLKTTTTTTPSDLFDDRLLGPVQLQNHYKFTNPFDIKTENFDFVFSLYKIDSGTSGMMIETVRLLDGTQQIAEQQVNQEVTKEGTTVKVKITEISQPEEEHTLSLGVWYKYNQDGTEKRGNYKYTIGKITLISPG